MQPSRIVQELIASGMDPAILLAIAQENLRNLRETMNELPAPQKDQDGLLPVLQQSNETEETKKSKQAASNLYSSSELVRDVPRMIAEVEIDIEMLTRYLESDKDNDHQKSPGAHERESIGGHGGE
ncbi:MAG: hypothetical protein Q9223_004398 [Gallowayella weberi]